MFKLRLLIFPIPLLLSLLMLSACHHHRKSFDKTPFHAHEPFAQSAGFDAALSQCYHVAARLITSYAGLPNHLNLDLPSSGEVITIPTPSTYEVILQHKGAHVMIAYCLTRHGYPARPMI